MIEKVDLNPDYNFTFSTYVRAGDFIFTSHHGGYNQGKTSTIEEQTELCLQRPGATLEKAGATLDDVVQENIYLKAPKCFQRFRNVFRRQFKNGYPARSSIISVDFLDDECLMQMDAVAYKPEHDSQE